MGSVITQDAEEDSLSCRQGRSYMIHVCRAIAGLEHDIDGELGNLLMSTDEQQVWASQLRVMRPFSLRFLHWLGLEKEQGILAWVGLTETHRNPKSIILTCPMATSEGSDRCDSKHGLFGTAPRLQDPQDPTQAKLQAELQAKVQVKNALTRLTVPRVSRAPQGS